ncbi:MAG: ISAzo13 family transposase [Candidatus Xenobiia bacterium LiM19]
MEPIESLTNKYRTIRPYLNEKQWRIYLATEAQSMGHGGVSRVSIASGATRATIHIGLKELEEPKVMAEMQKMRRPGGGRKKLRDKNPQLVKELNRLVDAETRGDPMPPLLYTTKSTRHLAKTLTDRGFPVSHDVVDKILREKGYSLQANAKTKEGSSNQDRDAQFRYINKQAIEYMEMNEPVISIDTKKKELVGEFKNAGKEWLPEGQPTQVNVHDFPSAACGKAIPYGVYDVARNTGWVSVGTDHDTATFAVSTIKRWWDTEGIIEYPNARRLFITADGGGSNGARNRLWKRELADFAQESGLHISVSHLPPGTSKWNKIEHRLFSHISMNWRGRPLISHEVVVGLIGATTTTKGLRVKAELDERRYETEIKVPDEEFRMLPIDRHEFRGEWNYTITPSFAEKS